MKTFAAFLMLCSTAFAGGPCYTGNCYVKPYVAAPVKYAPPSYTYNTTNTYHAPPVVLVGIPTPVAYNVPIAAQGYAAYGYTSVAQVFGNVDPALLFDKAARAGAEARAFAQAATDNETTLAAQRLQHAKELAETVAVGQTARELVRSISDANIARINAQAAAAAGGNGPGVFRAAAAPTTATGVLKARCVSCHAKYDREWDTLDQATRDAIFDHVTTADPSLRMPRAPGGKEAGEPLSAAERKVLAN